jgi:hypothetical protein
VVDSLGTISAALSAVMPGLVPGIHALLAGVIKEKDVDGRDKPGHDDILRTEQDGFRLQTSGGKS